MILSTIIEKPARMHFARLVEVSPAIVEFGGPTRHHPAVAVECISVSVDGDKAVLGPRAIGIAIPPAVAGQGPLALLVMGFVRRYEAVTVPFLCIVRDGFRCGVPDSNVEIRRVENRI